MKRTIAISAIIFLLALLIGTAVARPLDPEPGWRSVQTPAPDPYPAPATATPDLYPAPVDEQDAEPWWYGVATVDWEPGRATPIPP